MRSITVLRVEAPEFDIVSEDGSLRASAETPSEVSALVERLAADPTTWSDTRIAGGADGIVAARGAMDGTMGSWVYDLWLLEHIARSLEFAPLKRARVGPSWTAPYALGRSLEPKR